MNQYRQELETAADTQWEVLFQVEVVIAFTKQDWRIF